MVCMIKADAYGAGAIEIALREVILVVGHHQIAEVVGHEVVGLVGVGHHHLLGVEHGIAVVARLRTIDAIDILGDIHRGGLVDLEYRLGAHPDVHGALGQEVLGLHAGSAIHLEAVVAGIFAQVDKEEVVDGEHAVVDDVGAACGVFKVAGVIVAVVLPSAGVAIDDGLVGDIEVAATHILDMARTLYRDVATRDVDGALVDDFGIGIIDMETGFALQCALVVDDTAGIGTAIAFDHHLAAVEYQHVGRHVCIEGDLSACGDIHGWFGGILIAESGGEMHVGIRKDIEDNRFLSVARVVECEVVLTGDIVMGPSHPRVHLLVFCIIEVIVGHSTVVIVILRGQISIIRHSGGKITIGGS